MEEILHLTVEESLAATVYYYLTGIVGDEEPYAATVEDDTETFEMLVTAHDGVGVDLKCGKPTWWNELYNTEE